jgi:ADP-dependent NAD(P)H-hydrate dehydratase / NAD(P)H-hydrate epimerase
MKILTSGQIHEADQYTIKNEPVESIDLMERAAEQCFLWIKEKFGKLLSVKIFAGPGNNGGDGLALARMLALDENKVSVYLMTLPEKISPDALANYKKLTRIGSINFFLIENTGLPEITKSDIIIDALFGSGLSRKLDTLTCKIVNYINTCPAITISIDIPSGLYGENNSLNRSEVIIEADYTLTFQLPKLSFLFAENEKYVGELIILDIQLMPEAIAKQESAYFYTESRDIIPLLKKRLKFSHKGTFGHALLIAGSYGKMGAAVLASKACLRAGTGLLTCHIPKSGYNILQTAIPEAMVSIDPSDNCFTELPDWKKFTAIGIGPGINTSAQTTNALEEILQTIKIPMVLDADALNIISTKLALLELLPENTILTPHPGEFDRLAGPSHSGFERHLKQIELSARYKIIIVLKGAYTSITTPDKQCHFNSTGNPGMATAGSGDVLTGIILSLLAQGYSPLKATLIGTFIHGLAGDLVLSNISPEALIATDIINHLGIAFKNLTKL